MTWERTWHWLIDRIDEYEAHAYAYQHARYFGRTKFQVVEILETAKFGKMLILDGKIQSAALDEHIFHETLVHPAMLMHPNPRRVCIIGGGEGATLREILRYPAVEEAVMVDLDEEIVALCREHLPEWHRGAFEDPRVRLLHEDGRVFLREEPGDFDVVILDITDPVTADFGPETYRVIRSRLREPGILALQALELNLGDWEDHAAIRRALRPILPHCRSYSTYIPSFRAEWGFLVVAANREVLYPSSSLLEDRFAARLGRAAAAAGGLRFYSPQIHGRLFTLPEDLRDQLEAA
ncbi:MAG: spermidine synthase [candidate division NC10 bacterium]|nr:spermidine synthase [candidate division NC10 bacterium]